MAQNDIRYLTPINIEIKKEKYCRFKKSKIKFIDYKDPDFLLKLINEQGKILPRRLTGTSAKYQKKSEQSNQTCTSHCCSSLRCGYVEIIDYKQDNLSNGSNFKEERRQLRIRERNGYS